MSIFGITRQLGAVAGNLFLNVIKRTSSQFMSGSHALGSAYSTFGPKIGCLKPYLSNSYPILQKIKECRLVPYRFITLEYMHRKGLYKKVRRKRKSPLEGRPQLRGVVLKTLIKKPKKPNSANRKCVRLRLSTGREVTAYVPGEGHNLQEHNVVLVQGGRLQDTPGVKLVCIRGKYDLPHVKKK
ncbi:unnamed protein product [Lymnaea stagnalis]|uniref:Small ribosomal subunit protein uS12m n=1 Tax=Lymnaea stagnalis TaxID=6523 RepID=A0AAV2H5L1_LYMST